MSADLLKRLIEAGTPADLVAEVAMLAADATALQRRRQNDRDRQAARRHVTSRESADVTEETPSPLVPPKVSPTPPSSNPPISPNPSVIARIGFPPPSGVSEEQWRAFRKQRKKPINERSYVLLCNKLQDLAEAGWPPGMLVDLAIERGWETVFPPKDQRHEQHHPNIGKSAQAFARLNARADEPF
jgi:hypothetical protein